MTRWDFVVVGAGAAGCAMVSTLLQEPTWRVALVEAGTRGTGGTSPEVWPFRATLPEGAGSLVLHQGRGLGGSSGLQGGRLIAGHPADWAAWARLIGPEAGAALSTVLGVALTRLEAQHSPRPVSELARTLLAASSKHGWVPCDNFNRAPWAGAGAAPDGPYGRRWSSGYARLMAWLGRDPRRSSRLNVISGWEVQRLLLSDDGCDGVLLSRGRGAMRALHADQTVLCAGAIGTPSILLRSGIGPARSLSDSSTPVHVDSPSVGREVRDHPAIWLAQPAGPAAADELDGAEVLLRSYGAAPRGLPGCAIEPGYDRLRRPSDTTIRRAPSRVFAVASLVEPSVTGTISLPSADRGAGAGTSVTELATAGAQGPRIEIRDGGPGAAHALTAVAAHAAALLAAAEDTGLTCGRPTIVSRRVLARGSRDGSCALGVDDWLSADPGAVAAQATTGHHWHGSAPHGTDPAVAVADGFGRVHGVPRLRTADASAIPVAFRANTHLATEVVAEVVGNALKA